MQLALVPPRAPRCCPSGNGAGFHAARLVGLQPAVFAMLRSMAALPFVAAVSPEGVSFRRRDRVGEAAFGVGSAT